MPQHLEVKQRGKHENNGISEERLHEGDHHGDIAQTDSSNPNGDSDCKIQQKFSASARVLPLYFFDFGIKADHIPVQKEVARRNLNVPK